MQISFYTAMFPSLREEWGATQMLGFGYLSAWLKQRFEGIEVHLAQSEEDLLSRPADIVGITSASNTYGQARRIAALVRERQPGAKIVIGGPHVTVLPERMDREFDYGVIGEGEETFAALVGHLAKGKASDAGEIEGLVHWRDGRLVVNPRRDLIEPLDNLPFPDRGIYGAAHALRGGSVSIMTSRGCPYHCSFCAATLHWQRLRIHSPEYVLREIDHVIRLYRPHTVVVLDDLFVAGKERLAAIAEGIRRKGHHRHTRFHVSGRANLLTDSVCALLRSINTQTVFIGLESACDHVLETLGKKGVTAESNQRAVDNVTRHGMRVVGTFILGTPGETFDDLYTTYCFILRNLDAFESLNSGILQLLPGTKFWEQGLERGLVDDALTGIVLSERDVEDGWWALNHCYPMLNDAMSRRELLGFYLTFKELARYVKERRSGARNIDAMGIRQAAAEILQKFARKLYPH